MMNGNLQKFLDELKQAESAQETELSAAKENPTAASAAEDKNTQQTGGKIMGRFTDRSTQYPGRIKLKKVAEESDGTIYDSTPAEGTVYSAGTPLNAETLNALEDNAGTKVKLYRHRLQMSGTSTDVITGGFMVAMVHVYTTSAAKITTVSEACAVLGSGLVPAAGCAENGSTYTVLCAEAQVDSTNISLRGMYFAYESGNGIIKRISANVTSVSDTVSEVV